MMAKRNEDKGRSLSLIKQRTSEMKSKDDMEPKFDKEQVELEYVNLNK